MKFLMMILISISSFSVFACGHRSLKKHELKPLGRVVSFDGFSEKTGICRFVNGRPDIPLPGYFYFDFEGKVVECVSAKHEMINNFVCYRDKHDQRMIDYINYLRAEHKTCKGW